MSLGSESNGAISLRARRAFVRHDSTLTPIVWFERSERQPATSTQHRASFVTLARPIGIQLLAALLTLYTMGGFLLALRVSTSHDERYRWWLITGVAVAFAVACGAT